MRRVRGRKDGLAASARAFTVVLFLSLSLVGMARAGDFGTPSNLAGIWKMEILPGTHLVSFPLLQGDANVTALLADHFPAGASYEEATRIVGLGWEQR